MNVLKRSPWVSFFNAGGCIPGDTMMILDDGEILTAKEIVEDKLNGKRYNRLMREEVLARACEAGTLTWNGFSPKDGRIITAYKLPSDGKLVEISTSSTKLRLTPEHKVLVDSKNGPLWKKASSLRKGDHLYSPRTLEVKNSSELPCVLDWLPASTLARLEPKIKEEIRKKLKARFENLKKAARVCGISYKRLTHSTEGLSVKELRSVSKEIGLDLRLISKKVKEVVKGTATSKIATDEIDAELMYVLGLIASDGSISFHNNGGRKSYKIRFDNNEKALIDRFLEIFRKWVPGAKISYEMEGNLHRTLVHHYPFATFASFLGLKGLKRKEYDFRRIFRMPENFIAYFVAGFFDGDGTVVLQSGKEGGKLRKSLEIAIKDYKTAKMIQLLLKRLGIVSRILASINRSTFGTRIMHSVRITTNHDIALFVKKIPVKHPKKSKKLEMLKRLLRKDASNIGKIYHAPLICGKIIKEIRKKYGLRQHEIFDPTFLSMIENGKRVERSTIKRICGNLERKIGKTKETRKLRMLISDEYYLDPVKCIENIRTEDRFVYNFNVAETHKYVPEGAFVVSNCNGCTLEFLACINPRYDVTRFGIEVKASAKHADVLVVTGIVNKQNRKRLINIYDQLAEPKRVVAVGACAITGGIYKGSHAHAGPVDKVIPVTVYVPGCPPRPESVIQGIMEALKK